MSAISVIIGKVLTLSIRIKLVNRVRAVNACFISVPSYGPKTAFYRYITKGLIKNDSDDNFLLRRSIIFRENIKHEKIFFRQK